MQDYSAETSYGTQGDTLGATGTMTTEQMKDSAQDMAQQTKNAAANMADKAREQVKTKVETQKERAVDSLGSVTQTLHDTGRELQDKGQPTIGNLMDEAATQIDNLTNYLRGRNVEELFGDIEEMARRKPTVFIGGAFVLGLAVARFLKSSRPASSMDWSRQDRSTWASSGTSGTADYRASLGATSTMGAAGTMATPGMMGTTDVADTTGAYGTPGAMDTSSAFETSDTLGVSDVYGTETAGVSNVPANADVEETWTSELDRTNVTEADLEAEEEDLTSTRRTETI